MAIDNGLYRRLLNSGIPHHAAVSIADPDNKQLRGGLLAGDVGSPAMFRTSAPVVFSSSVWAEYPWQEYTDERVVSRADLFTVDPNDNTLLRVQEDGIYFAHANLKVVSSGGTKFTGQFHTEFSVSGESYPPAYNFDLSTTLVRPAATNLSVTLVNSLVQPLTTADTFGMGGRIDFIDSDVTQIALSVVYMSLTRLADYNPA